MVKLSTRILPYITGYAHIQTNPYNAHSTPATVQNAHRILAVFRATAPSLPASRVCIKIPSTYPSLLACRALEEEGVATLATTLFTPHQALLAAKVGCTYVAPYVNELRVHFEQGFVDADKGFEVAKGAGRWFVENGAKTRVLVASLVSVEEVLRVGREVGMGMRGHVTVSPPLLAELAALPASVEGQVGLPNGHEEKVVEQNGLDEFVANEGVVDDEAAYRMAVTRWRSGDGEWKLTDAINLFADMQDRMEDIVKGFLEQEQKSGVASA